MFITKKLKTTGYSSKLLLIARYKIIQIISFSSLPSAPQPSQNAPLKNKHKIHTTPLNSHFISNWNVQCLRY